MTLGRGHRYVGVAVDAAGIPGGRTFTYHVPASFPELAVGEGVLVEYGRRHAVGVVLDSNAPLPDRETKPVLERIHSDEPLLPPLQARLAAWIAEHYFAPPGMVVRAMLPPGLLERVALVAIARGGDAGGDGPRESLWPAGDAIAAIRQAVGAGLVVDDLPRTGSRAALLRELRAAEAAGTIRLEWRMQPRGARRRLERVALLTPDGVEAARGLGRGEPSPGRPLGRRQVDLLRELVGDPQTPVAAAELASRHGAGAVTSLGRRGLLSLATRVRERRPPESLGAKARGVSPRSALPRGGSLTAEQAAVVARISALIGEGSHVGLLLEGATASGKTAVYAAAVSAALAAGRGAIVLVPEIALAVPLLDRLQRGLGIESALLHSALSDGERSDEWRRIRSGEARVVVGTRTAILAPLADVGLVVVDEEHDAAYKSDRTPRYQARDVALELGRAAGAPVLLGSATPDVISLGRVALGELEHHRLRERATGAGVRIEVVDLRQELAEGNRGLLSVALTDALRALDRGVGDRAILVLNRRGSASVILCRDCGYVQVCPECQRPLVFHATVMALRCHHCGATAPVARRCPACDSPRIRYLGGGTERVEREVRLRHPELRVGRLDRDIVERKGAAVRVVDDFADGRLDVLVGTSLVTKGLDVPEVTLVGVVSADVALNLPDERAAERTYQLLAQAVGRAGRGERQGRAIIQSYQPDHPAISAVVGGDASAFIESELAARRSFGSPPFGSVIKLTVAMEDRDAAENEARRLAESLRERAVNVTDDGLPLAAVLGPAPAYVARRGERWRFHLILRGPDPRRLLETDPGPPWSIDVDPESVL
ncbi:MAG: primosomal protein N' [Chloroflexi bacterium]|nr:primosomal protein N' [Chloroflexota bacterium]